MPKELVHAPEQMKLGYTDIFTRCRKRHYKAGATRMCKEHAMSKLKAAGWTFNALTKTWILKPEQPLVK
jgi:hypothetical protein